MIVIRLRVRVRSRVVIRIIRRIALRFGSGIIGVPTCYARVEVRVRVCCLKCMCVEVRVRVCGRVRVSIACLFVGIGIPPVNLVTASTMGPAA